MSLLQYGGIVLVISTPQGAKNMALQLGVGRSKGRNLFSPSLVSFLGSWSTQGTRMSQAVMASHRVSSNPSCAQETPAEA